MSNSTVALDFYGTHVGADVMLPVDELTVSSGRRYSLAADTLSAAEREAVTRYVAAHLGASSLDGQPWSVTVTDARPHVETYEIHARVRLQPPAGAGNATFVLHADLIRHRVPAHEIFVTIRNDWDASITPDDPRPLGLIDQVTNTMQVQRANGSVMGGLQSVFALGRRHIAEGTDHLLFLLVLLLPAPLLAEGRTWGRFGGMRHTLTGLVRVVTAFTVGHSLTLLIGILGWLRLPVAPVEVVIAASILVAAVHAFRPVFSGREVLVAGGFGLIHGLAFASAVSSLALDAPRLALTVLGFNLGIEVMQLTVLALIVPWLVLLARTPFYTPVRVAGAVVSAVAAANWGLERALGISTPTGKFLEEAGQHGLWLAAFLAAVALLATLVTRHGRSANV